MKRCPTLLTTEEMQVKTTRRHHFTPSRMVRIRQRTVLARTWRKWNSYTRLVVERDVKQGRCCREVWWLGVKYRTTIRSSNFTPGSRAQELKTDI